MNKSELISAISRNSGLEKREAEQAVDSFVTTVMSEVKAGRKVALIGFGTFNPTARAARAGRNPATGAPVRIAASKGVRFAAGSTFKSALNNRGTKVTGSKKAAPSRKAGAKKTAATKTASSRATAKKATVKRAAVRKAPAKKTTAKRTPAARKATRTTAKSRR